MTQKPRPISDMSPDLIVIDEMIAEVQKQIDADSPPKKKVRRHARPIADAKRVADSIIVPGSAH